jgi:aryl-phospho-beta-D-glucosidase BglC (GH1 family)/PKD repeat protein
MSNLLHYYRAIADRYKLLSASLIILMGSLLTTIPASAQYPAGSPVGVNGKLKVSGTQLVNECGNAVQLRGMSTHGPQWFQNCYTTSALDALANNWGIDVFRIAMYVQEGGYVNNPSFWKTWIDNMVDACGSRGVYCVIDWHVLNPGDPNANITESRDFWTYMSTKHKNKKHVLYEICNEPNGVNWATIKTYANDIIPRIRANDPNTVIIVGTPTWSQDVDVASNDKLNYTNLMYTLHFYSGTHTGSLRAKGNTALANGAPLFVTEFGTSQASGDGGPYLDETQLWIDWMATNKISWINWSFADKSEVSAALSSGACAGGNWTSTTTSGAFIKQRISSPADNFVCSSGALSITASAGTGGKITPSGSVSIAKGSNQTFTIAANSGYQISDVTVDGASVGKVGTYTFNNVQVNHSIAASFSPVSTTQKAYPNGAAWAIPGTIEAVNYDIGGEGVAYHDTTVGNAGAGPRASENVDTEFKTTAGNVGWIVTGEWLEYTVNVAQAGNYDIKVQVASEPGGGSYHIEFNGVNKTGVKTVGATGGWGTFTIQNITGISLGAGEQVMRLYFDGGNFNVGTMTFTRSGTSNNPPVARVVATPTSGAAPLVVSFNASTSSDADNDVLSYAWNFGDNATGTGVTASHTYSTAGSYVATVTVSDGKGGSNQASVTITATGGSNNCKFGTPRSTALPTLGNKSYNKVYVLGTGGPNLNNVTKFTINWDLPNNGLYELSVNTNNGSPNWYVDLRTGGTWTLNQAQPKITLAGTGFPGLDGQYYVNITGADFVMVSVTKNYTLYFSNSTTAPTCTASARVESDLVNPEIKEYSASVYPNPFDEQLVILVSEPKGVEDISVVNSLGQTMHQLNKGQIKEENIIEMNRDAGTGLFVVRINGKKSSHHIKVIRK